MKFKILTLFPELFPGPLKHSLTGKALQKRKFIIDTINIRDFSDKKSNAVDDTPYGGGAGMIIKADVMQKALDHASIGLGEKSKIIYLSPGGKQLNSKIISRLQKFKELVLICGKYEGIDQRFIEKNKIEEISIGDYVLSGGELASFILIDTCVRLIPEVLGNKESLKSESFQDNLLEYPQYTKPADWKGMKVPSVLLKGNHQEISDWRLQKSIEKTKTVRPDLLKLYKRKIKGEK